MIKKVFIEEEILENIEKGKNVEGALRKDRASGKLVFKAYARQRYITGRKPDKVICQLPNGWLKESPKRLKLFTSQKKNMRPAQICLSMLSDLVIAKGVIMQNTEFGSSDGREVKG